MECGVGGSEVGIRDSTTDVPPTYHRRTTDVPPTYHRRTTDVPPTYHRRSGADTYATLPGNTEPAPSTHLALSQKTVSVVIYITGK